MKFYNSSDYEIVRIFGNACLYTGGILVLGFIIVEIIGDSGIWLAYRAMEYFIYGIFATGIYKIIDRLDMLAQEMKFFRHHYILKDTQEAEVLKKQREKENG